MSMMENFESRLVKVERKLARTATRVKVLENDAPGNRGAAPAKKAPAKKATAAVKTTAARGRRNTALGG